MGAIKKLVIADQIAPHVTLIFSSPAQFDGLTLLMGLLGYTAQIYCDFAGYSDIAIGCARILGYRLPENFQMPLHSKSITEFWRRWHITLSRWFRDYLFLPLELATRTAPNRAAQAAINIIATMVLCGLWHGASWNFVVFGGIHGVGLAAHILWTKWKPLAALKESRVYGILWDIIARLLTLGVILLGFVFFRTNSFAEALNYLGRLVSWAHTGTRLDSPYILGAVAAVTLAHFVIRKDRNLALELPQMSLGRRIAGYATLLVLLVLLGATDSSPFIYFKF
jgi:alginate O-acetyltransferase complex protein AlgI